MKFDVRVKHAGETDEQAWTEHYSEEHIRTDETAIEYGKEIVQNFNRSLRPYEQERVFVSAVITGDDYYPQKCEECEGRGWVDDPSDEEGSITCPRCEGEGRV